MEEARDQMSVPTSVEWRTAERAEDDQAEAEPGPVSARPVRATYPTVFLGDGGELLLGAFDDAPSRADAEIAAGTDLHALAETFLRMRGRPIDGRLTNHAHQSAGTSAGYDRAWAVATDESGMWTPP